MARERVIGAMTTRFLSDNVPSVIGVNNVVSMVCPFCKRGLHPDGNRMDDLGTTVCSIRNTPAITRAVRYGTALARRANDDGRAGITSISDHATITAGP